MTALAQNKTPYQITVEQQNAAAAPDRSVWLAASAGTGKTKVLTDRLLRLLLDGFSPESMLCLTYTKAAAAEMANRLADALTAWVTLPRDALFKEFAKIGLLNPNEKHIDRARELFAAVLDCPGGLHIQTLHSFCQELLQRFPLEAGLTPNFTVLDEAQAKALREQTALHLLQRVQSGNDKPLQAAFDALNAAVGEDGFNKMLAEDLASGHSADAAAVAAALGVDVATTAAEQLARACAAVDGYRADLQTALQTYLDHGNPSQQEWGAKMAAFLAGDADVRAGMWDDYVHVYLTAKGELKAARTLYPAGLLKLNPRLGAIMQTEGERVLRAQESINAARVYELTCHYNTIAAAYLRYYTHAKRQQAAVDYDDLIQGAEGLLTDAMQAAWVRYKLDHALRHVLVDEAQDTSPAQWAILRALVDEFVQDDPDDARTRTVFVVGDEKQSIYSFNGADPRLFTAERARYAQHFHTYKKPFDVLPLTLSFRSTQAVLDVVNKTFTSINLEQIASRTQAAGSVELWPLVPKPPKAEEDAWRLPLARETETAPAMQLARRIASTIRGWLDNKEKLPDRLDAIGAGDVMILVQRRSTLMESIVRALKEQDVPVAGVDKLVLNNQLAVQDMLALAHFVLLPTDDLNLAALLKTPLIGVSEEQLFTLCHGRDGSLWRRVQQQQPAIAAYLKGFMQARAQRPYEFLQKILRDPCPGNAVSGLQGFQQRLGEEVLDPLHELLQSAIGFEANNTATLQGFLQMLGELDIQKKRELSEASHKVRVMTVHASKGLQAPIVFLADAAEPPLARTPRLLHDIDHAAAPPLYVPSSDMETVETGRRRAAYVRARREEYNRLLYVALTRAEDRLIVAGIAKKDDGAAPDSWYGQVASALAEMPTTKSGDVTVYATGQHTGKAGKKGKESHAAQGLPAWAKTKAIAEAAPMRPLAPGRVTEPDVVAASPLAGGDKRFLAGTITHRLLELLPGKTGGEQQRIMRHILDTYANELSAERLMLIEREVMAVLTHAEFAPLFGPGSQAEVPLVGMIGGEPIAGQVDRLLVTETEILVVDYKSNRPPPQTVENVDPAYFRQLGYYTALLQQIYPGRIVKAALLWTDGPLFMPIPQGLLRK